MKQYKDFLSRTLQKKAFLCNSLSTHPAWIAGFVDGEGCFTVDIVERKRSPRNVELHLCFSISQHKNSDFILHALKSYFLCGSIVKDRNNLVFRVRKREDLRNKILPFFKKYPLLTTKRHDFESFCWLFEKMSQGEHLSHVHLPKLLEKAYTMNMDGKNRKRSLLELVKMVNKS